MIRCVAQLVSAAAGTDLSGDGAPEIASLTYTGSSVTLGEPDPKRRLVLVLVEARLLHTPPVSAAGERLHPSPAPRYLKSMIS